jgi:hypothetical protein
MQAIDSAILRVAAIAFAFLGFGCATVGAEEAPNDPEMELVQKQAEDQTLARLSESASHDIADSAYAMAHPPENPAPERARP